MNNCYENKFDKTYKYLFVFDRITWNAYKLPSYRKWNIFVRKAHDTYEIDISFEHQCLFLNHK